MTVEASIPGLMPQPIWDKMNCFSVLQTLNQSVAIGWSSNMIAHECKLKYFKYSQMQHIRNKDYNKSDVMNMDIYVASN